MSIEKDNFKFEEEIKNIERRMCEKRKRLNELKQLNDLKKIRVKDFELMNKLSV